MGLLKTVGNAIGNAVKNVGNAAGSAFVGSTQDTFYREYFASGNMAGNIIMKRAERIVDGKRNSNAGTNENVINSGALVDIQVNQCMIIVENGAIVEFSAEPGRFVYDSSTAPSVLCGTNKGLAPFAEEVKNRFLNGGGRTSTQRIYFINLGKIWEPILWGTGNIPFRNCFFPNANKEFPPIVNNITLRGHGTCEIKVDNPLTFFCEIGSQLAGGDNNGVVTLENAGIIQSVKPAISSAIGRAISEYGSQNKVDYTEIGGHLPEITVKINEQLATTLGKRGLKVFDLLINDTLAPNEEDVEKLNESYAEYNQAGFFGTNQNMANYNLQRAAIKNFEGIGKNEGAGGGMGMMGVGLGMNAMGMGMGMGAGVGNLQFTPTQQSAPQSVGAIASTPTPVATWTCSCGAQNVGKFCVECGSSKPDENNKQTSPDLTWTCSCGTTNTSKFCHNCGNKKPAIKRYQCDKCGWKPEEGKTVRFCPECGDIFDDSDLITE